MKPSFITIERLPSDETYAALMLIIRADEHLGLDRKTLVEAFIKHEPRIVVASHFTEQGIAINPHNLRHGQERIVADRCRDVLSRYA